MNNDFIGDFIGFTFNNQHSNLFNICHVSDGSRYNENLLPNIQDMTAQVPGGDGMYYWDSYYVQRQFNVQVAFDGVQEGDWRKMKNWLGDREIHELWFDEAPYKVYMAKIASPPQFKYICFKEGDDDRTYKGEGTIVFTCYYPFAMSKNGKYLRGIEDVQESFRHFVEANKYMPNTQYYKLVDDDYEDVLVTSAEDFKNIVEGHGEVQGITLYFDETNTPEWAVTSKMLEKIGDLDTFQNGEAEVYNAGDIPADWEITLSTISSDTPAFTCSMSNVGSIELMPSKLNWNILGDSPTFKINSRTELITATVNSNVIACNKMITAGDFFKIPVSTSSTDTFIFNCPHGNAIQYDYLYL